MNIRPRRILALTFFILFFIAIAPLFMATGGWLYNLKKQKIEKTALLVTDTIPRGAEILLNGEPPRNWWAKYLPTLEDKRYYTPYRLNYLIPSDYELTFQLAGYHMWQKQIELVSGMTTFIENIRLWPTQWPTPFSNTSFEIAAIHPKDALLAGWSEKNGLEIYDMNTNKTVFQKPVKDLKDIVWHPNANAALIKHNQKYSAILRQNKTLNELPITSLAENVKWNSDTDQYLYWQEGNSIKQLDTSNQAITTLYPILPFNKTQITDEIFDWDIYNNELWIIQAHMLINVADKKIAMWESQQTDNFTKILYQDKNSIFITTNKNQLVIFYKASGQWLNILDENQYISKFLSDEKRDILWWWNDFEFGIIRLANMESRLITRISQPIITVLPIPDKKTTLALLVTEEALLAIEASFSDEIVIIELFSLPHIITAKLNWPEKKVLLLKKDDENIVSAWEYNFAPLNP